MGHWTLAAEELVPRERVGALASDDVSPVFRTDPNDVLEPADFVFPEGLVVHPGDELPGVLSRYHTQHVRIVPVEIFEFCCAQVALDITIRPSGLY